MTQAVPLRYTNVSFAYEKEPVLRDLSLDIRPGELTLLAAPNGAGKTTLLWLAAGLLSPGEGQVEVFTQSPFSERSVLGQVGFLAQGAPLPTLWTGQQVYDFQRDTFPEWDDSLCDKLTTLFKLDLSKKVKTLSRGERGKLALATMLCTRPKLLLLDEPTLGLDVATRRMLQAEILDRLAEEGCSILLSSHEIAEAERKADRLVYLEDGRISCDEAMDALLERHQVLLWSESVAQPPKELDWIELPTTMGKRALARSWNEDAAYTWLAQGGERETADLETIYLSLTGELDYA